MKLKILTNQRAVTLAATPERISEETTKVIERRIISITIRANGDNTGNLYVVHTENRANPTTKGYILAPGEPVTLDVHDFADAYLDLYEIWVGSDNNGDAFSYIAFELV